jgi:hypothetical protein
MNKNKYSSGGGLGGASAIGGGMGSAAASPYNLNYQPNSQGE